MQRVWFNKAFSSVGAAIRLIREADQTGDFQVVCSSTNAHAPAFLAAHESAVEPSGLKGQAYLTWCLDFCLTHRIGIFIPGKEASLISAERAQFEAQGTRVLCAAPSYLNAHGEPRQPAQPHSLYTNGTASRRVPHMGRTRLGAASKSRGRAQAPGRCDW